MATLFKTFCQQFRNSCEFCFTSAVQKTQWYRYWIKHESHFNLSSFSTASVFYTTLLQFCHFLFLCAVWFLSRRCLFLGIFSWPSTEEIVFLSLSPLQPHFCGLIHYFIFYFCGGYSLFHFFLSSFCLQRTCDTVRCLDHSIISYLPGHEECVLNDWSKHYQFDWTQEVNDWCMLCLLHDTVTVLLLLCFVYN